MLSKYLPFSHLWIKLRVETQAKSVVPLRLRGTEPRSSPEPGSFEASGKRSCFTKQKTDTVKMMAQFTTRVELHRATGEDYARLHSAMEQCGFSRTIQGADGNTYLLPTAEYERSGGDLTSDQIHNDAWRAAASVSQRFSILITEAVGITWSGLTQL
jgi:hypothetical protein